MTNGGAVGAARLCRRTGSREPELLDAPAPLTGAEVACAAQLACLLEVSAPKPGNVSPGRHFADARYEDFLASAVAIGEPLAGAGTRGVGATVRLAIESTARWTRSNTNLGIVLLLAPLARAALVELREAMTVRLKPDTTSTSTVRLKPDTASTSTIRLQPDTASPPEVVSGFSRTLRHALRLVLDATSVDDAREVYAAIRRAAPGGLGHADAQDVANEPTLPLVDVMRLAADRDGIAREYTTAFDATFGTGVPALEQARGAGLTWDDAIVETFLTLLAASPDTHVARRGGTALAADISKRARAALAAGGVRSETGRHAIDDLDRGLRDARNSANPGTTADLTAAAVFVVLINGGWS